MEDMMTKTKTTTGTDWFTIAETAINSLEYSGYWTFAEVDAERQELARLAAIGDLAALEERAHWYTACYDGWPG